jgi:purine nucleoside phosphorylase
MPEAALAREAGLDYASVAVIANAGAGLQAGPITEADIAGVLDEAMTRVRRLIERLADACADGG